jgi:putative (di)nucleoside polyphosphate hydrolase
MHMSRPAQYFRAGVGAVIARRDRLVLALERADRPGAWQLPQGGLKRDEEPLVAVYREIAEETGVRAAVLKLVAALPDLLAYELPADLRSPKTGRGQVQYWFLFGFTGDDGLIDLSAANEFRAWKWTTFDAVIAGAPLFRQPVYCRLRAAFEQAMISNEFRVAD